VWSVESGVWSDGGGDEKCSRGSGGSVRAGWKVSC
jgi:hypothetical protein